MSLKSGYYTLRIGNNLVGRSFKTEDYSLLPKPIYNATDDVESTWQIESLPGGLYRLRNFDAPIATIEGRLEAIVSPDVDENEKKFQWMITPESHNGEETLYNITTPSGDAWYIMSDKFSPAQILLSGDALKSTVGCVISNDDKPVGRGDDGSVPRRNGILNATQSKKAFRHEV
ncbi:hypothetical protein Clacol_002195 [Clathrus columnatus]|uniref:Uncharacterized protein n=1 Tax=Clathrus columnatus TaxID=1419009 RepID=A0AAV5A450_9AGAM|nr:hypothetical protein Clacol_002195 [Clathrus columnatus]